MAETRNTGVAAALEPLAGDCPPVGGTPMGGEQVELLDFDGPEGAEGPVSAVVERRRGPGRPKGSINKRTEDLRRFVLSRYKHPVVAAAELYAMPTADLAAYLDCKPLDAAVLQLKAMDFVAPFVESKMPAKVQVEGELHYPEFHLHLDGAGGARAVDRAGRAVDIVDLAQRAKAAMDQRLIDGEALRAGPMSPDEVSHDGGK